MFSEEEIRKITKAIWSIQLQLEASDSSEDDEDELDFFSFGEEMTMTASIVITGDWKGAVLFNASDKLARRAASIMFDTPDFNLEQDQISDALGELTSMTAGNLVGLIGGHYAIGLPMVVEGTFHSVRLPGTEMLYDIELVFEGEPLVVNLVQARPEEQDGSSPRQRRQFNGISGKAQ